MLVNLEVNRGADPGIELGWEAGSLSRCLQKSLETLAFSLNVFRASDLRPSIVFVGFRLFAPVFGFCQCNVTQNDTRRDSFRSVSRRKRTRVNFVTTHW